MAKRKRLTPPTPEAARPEGAAPEHKSIFPSYPMGVAPQTRRAPIADVAGAAAANAALTEVTAELEAARAEGRLVQSLPLNAVDAGHLVRDRLIGAVADEEMQSLMQSLEARGQQTPIEVMETAPGQYGLISGWRRLSALRQLHDRTGAARFANIRALVRHPDTAAEAYVAMVEENEIRVGLSYYERARIVARAVEEGVCETEKEALNRLFVSASRAKRSKIKSFLPVVRELGEHLNFPTAIGERLGLKLSARLAEDGAGARIRDNLQKAQSQTAEIELSLLERAIAGTPAKAPKGQEPDARALETLNPMQGEELQPGLWLHRDSAGLHLTGPGLTDDVEAKLRAMLHG